MALTMHWVGTLSVESGGANARYCPGANGQIQVGVWHGIETNTRLQDTTFSFGYHLSATICCLEAWSQLCRCHAGEKCVSPSCHYLLESSSVTGTTDSIVSSASLLAKMALDPASTKIAIFSQVP